MLGEAPNGAPGCDSLPSDMQRDTPQVFVWASVGMGVLLAVLAVHLRTAVVAGGPVAVPDIPAYLGIAQWVGGDGLAPGDIPFQPGYGLLMAPLVAISQVSLLGTQGEVVHYLALVVNSLAATAAVVVAGRLGLVCSRRWWVAGAAGLIAAVHPSLSSASRIAWPETLLSLAVLIVALAVAAAALHAGAAAGQRAWARAGLFAALAVALHARMVVLVAAVVLTALLCRIGRRTWAALGMGLVAGGATTAVALRFTRTWPTERLSEAAQLDRGAEPILTVGGQLLALGGGTVGLGMIGLVTGLGAAIGLARKRRQHACEEPCGNHPSAVTAADSHSRIDAFSQRQSDFAQRRSEPLAAALLCLALGALGAAVLGGWTLTGSERADALLYGRYVDPWAVPLAVAALAWLAARPTMPRGESATSGIGAAPCSTANPRGTLPPSGSAVLGTVVAAAVLACAAVVGVAGGYEAAPRRIMTLSFSPAWTWLDDRLNAVAVAALVATLLGVLLAAAAWRARAAIGTGGSATSASPPTSDAAADDARRHAAVAPTAALGTLVAAVAVLGAVATVSNHRHLADVGAVARDQVNAAEAVSDAVEDDGLICLAHDRTSVPDYALWLYRMELPEIAHERVRLNAGDRPCSQLVIAHDDLAKRCTNARHLVDEPAASWALWHLPGLRCIGL